ncbi:MAG TPA: outer membrane beta-barrel protein [Bacteroidia bacterium]|jgi:iron complex outermembrane receptor protein|nr:outer membrane beta-barrel protein [Bacteroidia bacterium]
MIRSLTLIVLIFISTLSFSQNLIKGTVTDSTQNVVQYCPMALMNAKDSSQVKGNISDSTGFFIFEKVKPGGYFIKFTAVNFKAATSGTFTVDSLSQITLPAQILKTEGVNLKEVSIAVYKPAIEFKKGVIVMNVENDILAKGNTVFELLKRVPGVMIDAQNNITVNGLSDVRFMIDERLQQMPAPQVIDMLMGMSADAVSKIELIKNPPARYDAAGTGGLINIVTKRAKVKGYSGNVAFGVSQGQRLRWGPSFSFNYKANKLSIFSNLSYGHWDGIDNQKLERTITTNGNTEIINSYGTHESFQSVFSGSGGIEYDITKKMLIGFYVNGNKNDDHYTTNYQTGIGNSSFFNYSKSLSLTNEKYNTSSPNYNLSLLQKLDSTGGQIKLSLGYNNYSEKLDKTMDNNFYDNNDIKVAPAGDYTSSGIRTFDVYTGKLDLNKTFKNKLSLEAGVKENYEDDKNNTKWNLNNQSTGFFIGDTTFYNRYRFKQNILAAYTTLARSWDKIGFSIGLRAEQTDYDVNYMSSNYHFKRNYINLFPSGSLDFNLNKKNTITAAYSYRIRRPYSGMLNPVRQFNDQLNYGVGNPEIRPQFAHHFNLDYNYNQIVTVSLGYDKTKDFTFYYSYTPNNSRVNIDTISNLPKMDNGYLSVSAQKRIKWYSFQTYGVAMYQAFFGSLKGEDVTSHTVSYYFNLNQEFYLPKDFKIAIWAGRGSAFQHGPQTYHPRSAIHISIDKSFFNQKLNITLAFQDVLYKDYFSYTTKYSDQSAYWYDRMDTRRFRLRISYRFGKMQIQQRLNTDGGGGVQTGK